MSAMAKSVRRETWSYCADANCMECSVMRISGMPATLPAPRLPLRLRIRRAFRR